jgi:adenosylhomocysteinase
LCGKGVALRAKGFGAKVIVAEVDPVKALEAWMDGHGVMQMDDAAAVGDIFVTVTGCSMVITERHFARMKDGALLCNAGHFDVEIDIPSLERLAVEANELRANITGYRLPDGRTLCLLARGRLVNLASGDGHPAEIMDLSFALQLLGANYLLVRAGSNAPLPKAVMPMPRELDLLVARCKLESLGVAIDELTSEQEAYAAAWCP